MYADKDQHSSETSDRYNTSKDSPAFRKTPVFHGMPLINDANRPPSSHDTQTHFLACQAHTKTKVALKPQTAETALLSNKLISKPLNLPDQISNSSIDLLNAIKTSDHRDYTAIESENSKQKFEGHSFGSLGTTVTYQSTKLSLSDEDEKQYILEEGEISCHSRESSTDNKSLSKDIPTPSTVAGTPKDMQSLGNAAFFNYTNLNSGQSQNTHGDPQSYIGPQSEINSPNHKRDVNHYESLKVDRSPNNTDFQLKENRNTYIPASSARQSYFDDETKLGSPLAKKTPTIPQLLQVDYTQRDGGRLSNSLPESAENMQYRSATDNSSTSRSNNSSHQLMDLRRDCCDQNLFVFHLPSEWREEDLKQAFCEFGTILSTKVVKRPDGSSKGYGFVCFEDRECAIYALEKMDGFVIGGKRLKVSLKKTPEECLKLQVQKLMKMSQQNCVFDRDRDCSLFVFHLPPHWDDSDLRKAFLAFGSVVAAKVSRKDDGTSRGYGFVTCSDPKSAALAIMNLNGMQVANKRLKVQPKQLGAHIHPKPDCTVFIFHLPNDWTDNALRQIFGHSGRVVTATVQRDSGGRSRGFGFVTFDKPQSARDAVADLNGLSIGVKRLKVSLKKSTSSERGDSRENLLDDGDFDASDFYTKYEDSANDSVDVGHRSHAGFDPTEETSLTSPPPLSSTPTTLCARCGEGGSHNSLQNSNTVHHNQWCGRPMKMTDGVGSARNMEEFHQSGNPAAADLASRCMGIPGHHFVATNPHATVLPMDYRLMQSSQKLVGNNLENSTQAGGYHNRQPVMNEPFNNNNVSSGRSIMYDQSTATLRLLQQTLLNQSTAALLSGGSAHHLQATLAAAMTHTNHPNTVALGEVSQHHQPNPAMVRYQQRHQQGPPPPTGWAAPPHIPYAATHPSLAAIAASIPARSGNTYSGMTKMGAGNGISELQQQRNQQQTFTMAHSHDKYIDQQAFHHEGMSASGVQKRRIQTPGEMGA